MILNIYLLISLCLGAVFYSAPARPADTLANRYVSLALQGDLRQAESLFAGLDPATDAADAVELSQRFQDRFIGQNESRSPLSGDEFTDAIVVAYRTYWTLTLTRELTFVEGEDYLESSLRQAVANLGALPPAIQESRIYERVGALLSERGFYYLDTPAPPLRDLFLWKKEEQRNYSVRLTDRTQKVQVIFMSDMYSMGWKDYATLGLVATTGWVEDGRLYCIEWAYDRSSENFEVSYLKHESRHLADLERFPTISSQDLEYRAKLTELAFASTSHISLLKDFTNKSAANPVSPHAYANYRVTRDVYRELYGDPFPDTGNAWHEVSSESVSAAARKLLRQNTRTLQGD